MEVKRITLPNNVQLFFCPVLPDIRKSVALFKDSLSQPACPSATSCIMIPYLARLLDTAFKNGTIPRDWKKTIIVAIHKGGNRSVVKNYRPPSLTSVVCKQMEHVIAGYIQVWEDRN